MKKKDKKFIRFVFASALFALLIINSCGYRIHRQAVLPFTEIQIGSIENRTFEPKLHDKLQRALTEEFLKQGISTLPAAPLKLNGVIHKFQMSSLSEKKGTTIEYSVNIKADFKLIDENGDTKAFKNITSPFIVSFAGSGDFGMLLANRAIAEKKALEDIAMQIVGALIFK
jgi:outer membrane lipopolysaccharide assembly protein LptE/RlpB